VKTLQNWLLVSENQKRVKSRFQKLSAGLTKTAMVELHDAL
jgi:hypothetical protein